MISCGTRDFCTTNPAVWILYIHARVSWFSTGNKCLALFLFLEYYHFSTIITQIELSISTPRHRHLPLATCHLLFAVLSMFAFFLWLFFAHAGSCCTGLIRLSLSSCCRRGHQVFSVRSATWCSATNQRSALTTTRRTATPCLELSPARDRTSVTFAARSLQRNPTWKCTCRPSTVSVTLKPSSAALVRECSSEKTTYKITWKRYIENKQLFIIVTKSTKNDVRLQY